MYKRQGYIEHIHQYDVALETTSQRLSTTNDSIRDLLRDLQSLNSSPDGVEKILDLSNEKYDTLIEVCSLLEKREVVRDNLAARRELEGQKLTKQIRGLVERLINLGFDTHEVVCHDKTLGIYATIDFDTKQLPELLDAFQVLRQRVDAARII